MVLSLVGVTGARAQVPTPKVTPMPAERPGTPDRNYPFFATDIVLSNFGYVEEEFMFEGTASTYTQPAANGDVDVEAGGLPYRSRLLVRRPATGIALQRGRPGRMAERDQSVRHGRAVALSEGFPDPGRVRLGGRLGTKRRAVECEHGPEGVEPEALRHARCHQRRHRCQRRARRRHLLAGGRRDSERPCGPRRAAADGRHRRGPVAVGQPHGAVPERSAFPESGVRRRAAHGVERRDSSRHHDSRDQGAQRDRAQHRAPVSGQRDVARVARHRLNPLGTVFAAVARRVPDARPEAAGGRHVRHASTIAGRDPVCLQRGDGRPREMEEIRHASTGGAHVHLRRERRHHPASRQRGARRRRTGRPGGRGGAPGDAAPGGRGAGRGGRGGEPAEKPLVRDARGNALGGIRLAEIEAPTAKESGELCGLGGTHVPFDTATLNSLYPTHAAYVAKVTAAANAAARAGFMVPSDAAETIERAKASIYGMQLTCGPLCADVRQFPNNPSSMLLSNQTRFLVIKDGDALVKIMDEATKRIAEGYTLGSSPAAKKKFSDAAAVIQRYMDRTKQLAARGNMPPETEKLLVDQAATLKQKVMRTDHVGFAIVLFRRPPLRQA